LGDGREKSFSVEAIPGDGAAGPTDARLQRHRRTNLAASQHDE